MAADYGTARHCNSYGAMLISSAGTLLLREPKKQKAAYRPNARIVDENAHAVLRRNGYLREARCAPVSGKQSRTRRWA